MAVKADTPCRGQHRVFCGLNNIMLDAPDDDAYDLVIAIASGTASYKDAVP